MKNILLNSCYPPPPPAAKEAPSPVLLPFTACSSARTAVDGEAAGESPCGSAQHRSRARSAPGMATELPQPRRCPSWCSSEPQPRAARLFQEVEVHLVPTPARERRGSSHRDPGLLCRREREELTHPAREPSSTQNPQQPLAAPRGWTPEDGVPSGNHSTFPPDISTSVIPRVKGTVRKAL